MNRVATAFERNAPVPWRMYNLIQARPRGLITHEIIQAELERFEILGGKVQELPAQIVVRPNLAFPMDRQATTKHSGDALKRSGAYSLPPIEFDLYALG